MRVSPGAARDRILGTIDVPQGRALKLAVHARATDGRANAAAIEALAAAWGIPKSTLSLDKGATRRLKTIRIAGDPQALAARLAGWFERLEEA